MEEGHRIAADIGGTFTDIASVTADGAVAVRKVPSTPANYGDGVVRGVGELTTALDLPLRDVGELLHGCTVATNTILELKGARTALLTTKGFRDVLELRRIRVPRLYEPLYVKPAPLVPRHLRFEVDERLDASGAVIRPLQTDDVRAAIEAMRTAGVEAVAVCFLHSYANPAHETQVGAMLRREMPDLFVSLSVEVHPQRKEYERTSTTVINSYVGPPVKAYLQRMRGQLRAEGMTGRLLVMQSSGGILDADTVMQMPAQIVEGGPAAGVIGAAHVGRQLGYENLITLDMGGTTAKAAIVENGELMHTDSYEVGTGISTGTSLAGGGGYALSLPAIDISEVGAGGGSIVWLDKAGSIKVGPQSAGADPGPACYDTGGTEPTVTDANVVLGLLNPRVLAGGSVLIRADLSRAAIERRIAGPLGRDVLQTAHGIRTVANANMMRAVKAVTTYRGRDPRDFTLFAFGGNGGVHGVDLARALQISEMIVPPAAGVFSAAGLLFANMEMNLSRAFLHPLAAFPWDQARRVFDGLEAEISRRMGYDPARIGFRRLADMRYRGQAFELTVALSDGATAGATVVALGERFEAEHERRYGHRFAGAYPLETVNLRVIGTVARQGERRLRQPMHQGSGPRTMRQVHFGPDFGTMTTPVIDRAALSAEPLPGPLIVEESDSTTVVPPDCSAQTDDAGNIVIRVGSPEGGGP
jgi:N-methylhydantoinase A